MQTRRKRGAVLAVALIAAAFAFGAPGHPLWLQAINAVICGSVVLLASVVIEKVRARQRG